MTAEALTAGYRVEIVKEEGRSGRKMSNRPQLKAALKRLNSGEAQALFATKADRVARSTLDLIKILEQSNRHYWDLKISNLQQDPNTPEGKLFFTMIAAFAEFESLMIAERQIESHAERKEKGQIWGVTNGSKSNLPIEVRERIRSDREQGKSLRLIAEGLNADRVPTALGGKRWYASTIKHYLDSPATRKAS